jgi:hypothetical protein
MPLKQGLEWSQCGVRFWLEQGPQDHPGHRALKPRMAKAGQGITQVADWPAAGVVGACGHLENLRTEQDIPRHAILQLDGRHLGLAQEAHQLRNKRSCTGEPTVVKTRLPKDCIKRRNTGQSVHLIRLELTPRWRHPLE